MKAELFALLTAVAGGVGGYFEKKGLHLGNLSPTMGITLRTATALVSLAIASYPQWKACPGRSEGYPLYGRRRRVVAGA